MTGKPEGTLLDWLVKANLNQFLQGYTINDADYVRFRAIADEQHPEMDSEQRDAWAVYACLTHPECAGPVVRIDGVDEKGRVPVIAKTLHMIHSPLPTVFPTLEVHCAELPVLQQKVEPVECIHSGFPKGFDLAVGPVTVQPVKIEPVVLEVDPFIKKTLKWLLVILGLFLLLGVVHEARAEALKPIGIPAVAFQDHDVFCLAAKQAGTPVSGSVRCGGLVYVNCSTNMTCTFSGMTLTLAASGGGGTPGGAANSVQFNNAGAFGGFGSWNGSVLDLSTFVVKATEFDTDTANGAQNGNIRFAASDLFCFRNAANTNNICISKNVSDQIAATSGFAGSLAGNVTGDVTGNVTGNVSGNAGTATALAADPANCVAGEFPLGVAASGAVQNCTALPTTISGTAAEITASAATGPITLSLPTALTFTSKTVTNGTFTTPIISGYTVAGLPAAGTAGRVAVVTDASAAGSCTSGGGAAIAWCRDSGAAWVPLGDGGGAGGVTSFNARTGAVLPAAADYSLDQIGNPGPGTTFSYALNQDSGWVMQGTGRFRITGAPLQLGALAAPGSPAAGFLDVWEDSTDLRLHDKNSAGTIGTTVVADAGTANQWFSAMSAAGVFTKSQPSFSNISGSLGSTQLTGTSGGVPYFSAANTYGSSGALTANMPVIGGGAGVAPSVGTVSGNTTAFVTTTGTQTSGDCVKIDANGNHIANGSACGGGSSGSYFFPGLMFGLAVSSAGKGVASANQIQTLEVNIPMALSITTITFEIQTTQASTSFSCGLYNSAGTLVLSTGAVSVASGTTKTTTIGATAVPAGVYYFASTFDGTTAKVYGYSNAYFSVQIKGGISATASSGGALPASITVPTGILTSALNFPMCSFR